MKSFSALLAILTFTALPLLATEPNPSKGQSEQIEKLFAAMDLDKTLHDTIDAIYQQIEKQLTDSASEDPERLAEAKETFAYFRERAAKIDFGGEFKEAYARLYGKYFTEQELADLVTFYRSPAGRKSIEVMPQMTQEAMALGGQHLGPQIQKAMQEAEEMSEQKRPWRRTMRDIRTIATAVEAYAIDHDELLPEGDLDAIKKVLEPDYVKELPTTDMWKHEYAYVVSEDRRHFRIVSAGADSNFEWDSRRIAPPDENQTVTTVYKERLEDDLIFADGEFIQAPVQGKNQ